MKKTFLLLIVLVFLTFNNQAQTVTDIDGNIYNTVTIGTQNWMKENLKTIHFRNGDTIQNVIDNQNWDSLTTGAYCNYNNSVDSTTIYGRLYNFYSVVDIRNLCPTGWHVATDIEWTTLSDYLINNGYSFQTGLSNIAKSMASTSGWWTDLTQGNVGNNQTTNNTTGFSALPSGFRSYDNGQFDGIGGFGAWWSSTESSAVNAWYRTMYSNSGYIGRSSYYKGDGFSIRCIKDSLTQINEINHIENIKIYPNPANDVVYINYLDSQKLIMQIYNFLGECVLQKELTSGSNNIEISTLANGIYVIKFIGTDWSGQKKMIKE